MEKRAIIEEGRTVPEGPERGESLLTAEQRLVQLEDDMTKRAADHVAANGQSDKNG